jgi:hypothetical protein
MLGTGPDRLQLEKSLEANKHPVKAILWIPK